MGGLKINNEKIKTFKIYPSNESGYLWLASCIILFIVGFFIVEFNAILAIFLIFGSIYRIVNILNDIKNDIIVNFSKNEIITNKKDTIIISTIKEIELYESHGRSASSVTIRADKTHRIVFNSIENMSAFVDVVVKYKKMNLIREFSTSYSKFYLYGK